MSNKKEYLLVGGYTPPDKNGKGEVIQREFYGQGMIFKSDEAFYDQKQHPAGVQQPDRFSRGGLRGGGLAAHKQFVGRLVPERRA